MKSPNDVRCTAAINGDIDRATRYDAERIWRWVIALLRDDQGAPRGGPAAESRWRRTVRSVGQH
jgi:hypothetical protein